MRVQDASATLWLKLGALALLAALMGGIAAAMLLG